MVDFGKLKPSLSFIIFIHLLCKAQAGSKVAPSQQEPFFNIAFFNDLLIFVGLWVFLLKMISRVIPICTHLVTYFVYLCIICIYALPFISFLLHLNYTGLSLFEILKLGMYFIFVSFLIFLLYTVKKVFFPTMSSSSSSSSGSHKEKKILWNTRRFFAEYMSMSGHVNESVLMKSIERYGYNQMILPRDSFLKMYLEQLVTPVFIYQLGFLVLFSLENSYQYCMVMLFLSLMAQATVVRQKLINQDYLRNLAEVKPIILKVYRMRKWTSILSTELVPGDLVALEYNHVPSESTDQRDLNIIPCDAILLSGFCVVDESMFTGESVPILKEGIQNENSNTIWQDARHSIHHGLFFGSKLIKIGSDDGGHDQALLQNGIIPPKDSCVVVVTRTGFDTFKGHLIKFIFDPEQKTAVNNTEAFVFISIFTIIGCGLAYYVWIHSLIMNPKMNRSKLLISCLLVILYVVPIDLFIIPTLVITYSLSALGSKGIYCTEPFRIPIVGSINVACFDKTGTLTANRLIMKGVFGIPEAPFQMHTNFKSLDDHIILSLASCHSLITLQDKVVGDYMELAILDSIDGVLVDNDKVHISDNEGLSVNIVKRFAFQSKLQRMIVIAKTKSFTSRGYEHTDDDDGYYWFVVVKGSPESLEPLLAEVPPWYTKAHTYYAQKGSRIIGLAWKPISPISNLKEVTRKEIEADLRFLGFLRFEAPLNSQSKPTIKILQDSNHKIVIVSGDHPSTTLYVASLLNVIDKATLFIDTNGKSLIFKSLSKETHPRQSFKLTLQEIRKWKHIALTGPAFKIILSAYKSLIPELLSRLSVCARFSPSNKETLMVYYNQLGYITFLCGDGTNDAKAFKKAHIGMVLLGSEYEKKETAGSDQDPDKYLNLKTGDASIAAPFSSRSCSIEGVLHLIRLGRSSLVTFVHLYKQMALFSLLSSYSSSILYLIGIRTSDLQKFLHIIPVFIYPSFIMDIRLGFGFVFHLCVFIFVSTFKNAIHFSNLESPPTEEDTEDPSDNRNQFKPTLHGTGVFLMHISMEISTHIVNYEGPPFNVGFFENQRISRFIYLTFGSVVILILQIFPFLNHSLGLVYLLFMYRMRLLVLIVLDILACFIVEKSSKYFFGHYMPSKIV